MNIPDGWKLVPELTAEMRIAGEQAFVKCKFQSTYSAVRQIWSAMLAAAPTYRASASVTPGPDAEEVAATRQQEPREALNSLSPLAGDQGALVEGWLPIDLDNPPAEPILAASINHGNQEVVVWRRRSGRKEYGWGNTGPNCDRFFANARYFTHYRPLAPVTQASTGGAA